MPISELVRKGIQRDAIVQNLQKEAAAQSARLGADKVFDLTPDYPILEPPASFNLSLQQLFEIPHNGLHRYMENAGYTDTRSRIAAELKQQTGLNFSQAEVIMTSGATGALNMALKAVLNPGEEVVLFAPLAYDYEAYVSNHAGTARIIPCGRDFLPDLDVFEAALTPRTKLVILNTPNNPSGAVYPEQTLEAIAGIIKRRSAAFSTRIYTVSDDSYRKFYYGEGTCPWILKHYPHTIIVSSYSKELSIPGERIGYTAVSPLCEDSKTVVGGLIHANRTLGFVNAPALMQNVVRGVEDNTLDIDSYRARRDFIGTALKELGYELVLPQGGFFFLLGSPDTDEAAWVTELKKQHVFVMPGSLYSAAGYVRVSYCVEMPVLEGALSVFSQIRRKQTR